MADEKNPEEGRKGLPPIVRTLLVVVGIVLVSAILALCVYQFALKGMLAGPGEEVPDDPVDLIPETATALELDSMQAAVMTDDPDAPGPILMYQVVLFCSTPEAEALVNNRKSWFETMVAELHRNRTVTEVNDRYTQEAILKQITQKANELLKRLGAPEEYKVLESKYKQFSPITP